MLTQERDRQPFSEGSGFTYIDEKPTKQVRGLEYRWGKGGIRYHPLPYDT